MGNLKLIGMFFMALLVAGSMYFILASFLRRLKQIEDDFWGNKPEKAGPAATPVPDKTK